LLIFHVAKLQKNIDTLSVLYEKVASMMTNGQKYDFSFGYVARKTYFCIL